MKTNLIISWTFFGVLNAVAVSAVTIPEAMGTSSNATVSTLSSDSTTEETINSTLSAFPPGRFPPRRTAGFRDYVYFVPDADPPLRMGFLPVASNLWRRDRRSEDDIVGALLLALQQASTSPPQAALNTRRFTWSLGSQAQQEVILDPYVEPHDHPMETADYRRPRLTWQVVRNVVIVLQEFVVAYPGVNAAFGIHLINHPDFGDVVLGTGALQNVAAPGRRRPGLGSCDDYGQDCEDSADQSSNGTVTEVL